jgi:hypothetical protein
MPRRKINPPIMQTALHLGREAAELADELIVVGNQVCQLNRRLHR